MRQKVGTLKQALGAVAGTATVALIAAMMTNVACAQAGATGGQPSGAGSAPAQQQAPLKLQSLTPETIADPFPPVNPKYFTAQTPTAGTVDSYLKAVIGYDPNRIWRVAAIQDTPAAGVTKVTALVSERVPNAKVQEAVFFVLPDGKHLLDGGLVLPFGPQPYTETRDLLRQRADGPSQGAAAKDLELVEFGDLQCPHCKEAQPIIKKLEDDFPNAHFVFENLPLIEVHPFAERAALYGVCVTKAAGNPGFWMYADYVYGHQDALTDATGVATLKAAARQAGTDPEAMAACSTKPETQATVSASVKLAGELGIDHTPTLVANGRALPLTGISYEALRQIVAYQATRSGVAVRTPLPIPSK